MKFTIHNITVAVSLADGADVLVIFLKVGHSKDLKNLFASWKIHR
ncbi:hypothetical protein SAMN04488030_1652 [Aliiroseovarius halocynthiae]|nr:hypothetical protein [Aliiroseovarius halocynthiae]SMR72907.1 hypothetical protein SAMN04488030_1652 [Aliiroseovarius halocynthiae]